MNSLKPLISQVLCREGMVLEMALNQNVKEKKAQKIKKV